MAELQRFERDQLEFARAVTFFDAIFAFAVTLLITTVDDFSPAAWSSVSALLDANGPSLLAFTISFFVVVSFWRSNHRTVTGFVALDNRAILLNCGVMFGIVLLPFATEALGKLTLPLPVAVYALVISLTYLMQFTVEFDADRRGLRSPSMTPHERRWMAINAIPLPLVFLGSIPLAFLVSPSWAQRSWIILLLVYPVLGQLEVTSSRRSSPAVDSTPPDAPPPRKDLPA